MKKFLLLLIVIPLIAACSNIDQKQMESLTIAEINDSENLEVLLAIEEENGKIIFKTSIKNVSEKEVTIQHGLPIGTLLLKRNGEYLTDKVWKQADILLETSILPNRSEVVVTYETDAVKGEYEGNALVIFTEKGKDKESVKLPFSFKR